MRLVVKRTCVGFGVIAAIVTIISGGSWVMEKVGEVIVRSEIAPWLFGNDPVNAGFGVMAAVVIVPLICYSFGLFLMDDDGRMGF